MIRRFLQSLMPITAWYSMPSRQIPLSVYRIPSEEAATEAARVSLANTGRFLDNVRRVA